MTASNGKVRARVKLTVEIVVGDAWGADVKAEQVRKQALEAAKQVLRRGLIVDGLQAPGSSDSGRCFAHIVGEPVVTAIMADLEEST